MQGHIATYTLWLGMDSAESYNQAIVIHFTGEMEFFTSCCWEWSRFNGWKIDFGES